VKYQSFDAAQIALLQKFRRDLVQIIRDANDPRRSNQNFQRQCVYLAGAFNEVCRRIDMRAGVRPKIQNRNIG